MGGYRKLSKIVIGGATRQASSAAGIAAVSDDDIKVLVHDAVRPLLDASTIDRCLDALDTFDAVDTDIPSPDTIIKLDATDGIADIPAPGFRVDLSDPRAARAAVSGAPHHAPRRPLHHVKSANARQTQRRSA